MSEPMSEKTEKPSDIANFLRDSVNRLDGIAAERPTTIEVEEARNCFFLTKQRQENLHKLDALAREQMSINAQIISRVREITKRMERLEACAKAARELYTASHIIHEGNTTEDDHFHYVMAESEMREKLQQLDSDL